jgi:hypothetical protein
MLTTTINQPEIAVRLYDNNTYGTTYGRGLYRKALYNGTVDSKLPNVKYLLDFYTYEDWANQATSDAQIEVLSNITPQANVLFSWVKHYDVASRTKTPVTGVGQLNIDDMKLLVAIVDEERGVEDVWQMTAHSCRRSQNGGHSPHLLATNGDLSQW